jgi:anthranilate synthase/aminodeoxychorismate synthase-like glutamine amidotransferase
MILLIDNYDSFTYNLYQQLSSLGQEVLVRRHDKITITELFTLNPQAIILSPGPGNPDQAGICLPLLQTETLTIPTLGICLGHQALAQAFGGTIIRADEPVHGKKTTVFHNQKDLYRNMPMPFTAARYHSLIVEKKSLPNCFIIDAENDAGIIMGMHHRDLPFHSMQFHPESILTEHGTILIENFLRYYL